MPKICCAVNCHKKEKMGSGRSFYRIPAPSAEKNRRERWISAVRRENWMPNEHTRLCSDHFINGAKSDNPLSPNYVPTIFDYTTSPIKTKRLHQLEVFERRQKRKRKQREEAARLEAAQALLELAPAPIVEEIGTDPNNNYETEESRKENNLSQTDLTVADINSIEDDNKYLRNENMIFKNKAQLGGLCSMENLKGKDQEVKNLTGLPSYKVLEVLYKLCSSHLKDKRSLTGFQQFILTLVRLRHGLSIQFLGYLFSVHESTVSRTFADTIELMYDILVPKLLFWPDRSQIRRTMPMCFRGEYGNCSSVIDCFEIFIERPSDLKARAQTYSQQIPQHCKVSNKHCTSRMYNIHIKRMGWAHFR